MTDTEQDRWGGLERLAESRLAGCRAAAKRAARFNGDYDKELAGQISFATVGSVPLAPLLELIAEARGRSVGIANGDEPHIQAELLAAAKAVIQGRGFNPYGGGFAEIIIDGKTYSPEFVRAAITRAEASTGEGVPCGGCGEKDPAARCMGCLHDFASPIKGKG
jgi:hypothetical protein